MPKKQIERLWLFGALVAAFLLVLIGYTMFISPQNTKTSSARSQVSAAEATNKRLQARINALREESKDLPKFQAELTAARQALPSTSGLPDFLRTLQSIGNATLTTVSSLTVGIPADVTQIVSAGGSSSSSGSSAATTKSGAPAGTTIAGVRVFSLPINATVNGSTSSLEAFLTQLQTVQPRAVLISTLTETSSAAGAGAAPSAKNTNPNQASMTLTMQAFVAPGSPSEQAQLSNQTGK
jgi:hypothetical protein